MEKSFDLCTVLIISRTDIYISQSLTIILLPANWNHSLQYFYHESVIFQIDYEQFLDVLRNDGLEDSLGN